MAAPANGSSNTEAPAPDLPQEVVVRAVHGSLECAQHHVIVGHFMGTPIAGAERFLDERLGRRLSARAALGQYPERLGQSIVVDSARTRLGERGFPPGAIVVGLDRPGELTRENLTTTVTAALVQRAVEAIEDPLIAKPHLMKFSAVPLGTSGVGAISVESAVAGLVDAVLAANDQLCRHRHPGKEAQRTWDVVRISGLEIVEVLADKAEQVAHAVRRVKELIQVDPGIHSELKPEECLDQSDGRLPPEPAGQHHAGEWQRIIIRNLHREQRAEGQRGTEPEGGGTVLEFTAVGRRARADRMEARLDTSAVEVLIAGAVSEARPGDQVGNTLYELLLPSELKSELTRIQDIQLIVDAHTADFPWEALTAKVGVGRDRELALRGGLLRQFRETEGVRRDIRMPAGKKVLVIGNPPAGGGFPPLPGARKEAEQIALTLASNGYDVSSLIWDDEGGMVSHDSEARAGTPGRQTLDALFSEEWRILHLAAHGRYVAGDSSRSGVIIDSEVGLTANVVRQLPVVPELVFLNCCYLGRVGAPPGESHRLAASVSRELMNIGVRAVVAAGWAVDDAAAVCFAQTFYERLLGGALLGTAVYDARRRVRKEFEDSMTWAAFQCYGDPGFRLATSDSTTLSEPEFVSSAELIRRVQTIKVLAGKIGLPDFSEIAQQEGNLADELGKHLKKLAKRKWDTPSVLYEFGVAYGELGDYERAVDCYRRAWNDDRANSAPLKLLEQLGNFEMRLAQRAFRKVETSEGAAPAPAGGRTVTVEVSELIRAAGDRLALALSLGETGERLALLGSYHKKAAVVLEAERQEHLAQSCQYYRRAHEWQLRHKQEPEAYYTLNWLQMSALAGTRLPPGEEAALLQGIKSQAAGVDFWSRVALADIKLTEIALECDALRELEIDDSTEGDLEQAYRLAFETRSSRRDRDSVIDHLYDVAGIGDNQTLLGLANRLNGSICPPAPDTRPVVTMQTTSDRVPADGSAPAVTFSIDMLPVAHGDSLVVTYGDPPHRILIDGGPAHRYAPAVEPYLAALDEAERRFELFVVTHVDSDHIDGAVILLQDYKRLGLQFEQLWFNGWEQLPPERGALQGEFLSALLPAGILNSEFKGEAVIVPSQGPLPRVTLPGGATLTLLSPRESELRRLSRAWRKAVEDAGFQPGDTRSSLELLARRKTMQPRTTRGKKALGADNAEANGSSIAFLFEYGGKSCLFTGDAFAPVLTESLTRLARERQMECVPVDVFKLPHHGSMSNVSAELFKVVQCSRFLISTNGAIFKHPDPQTLQLLADEVGECSVTFNYHNEIVARWEGEIDERGRARIEPTYVDGDNVAARITV